MTAETPTPLAPEDTTRLIEFARACKAAARAVSLYPDGHPAIATTLGRIVQLTSAESLSGPLSIGVVARNLLIDEKAPARVDSAVTDLAAQLHDHLVGHLTIHPGGDIDGWRNFLRLISRSPNDVRAEGGIARLWATTAGRHVELREIDYAEVLRERAIGGTATWERVIANCLEGDVIAELLDEDVLGLLDLAGDAEQLGRLFTEVEGRAESGGQTLEAKTAALVRLIQRIAAAVKERHPDRVDPMLRHVADAVAHVSPEVMVSLLAQTGEQGGEAAGLVGSVVSRMSSATIARFISRNAVAEGTSMDRLAQAFQTLVRDGREQERLLTLAEEDARATPLGETPEFEQVWSHVAERLLHSYSDEQYISTEYARQLSSARTQAVSVEHVSDDPPERLTAWLATVATSELRQLDLRLLKDLLRIERDVERWNDLMTPVVALIEDLLLVGDFEAARDLLRVIKDESEADQSKERRQAGLIALDLLAAGPMMRHVTTHLAAIDDTRFETVKELCVSFGAILVRPLAEALSTEERGGPRERLTAILIAFGAAGRRQVERLKTSPNPAVRRTAIYLLREFGGTEALPDLTELLNDSEPRVQREAVRAILNIGGDRAYRVLEQALTSGSPASRDAIMKSLGAVRDERATPLFAYILGHVDHRGPLHPIYLRAIESLGLLKDPEGIPALKEALHRGEWWAPRRSGVLRRAAAASLGRIGTADALEVLSDAAANGPRGVRAVARAALAEAGAHGGGSVVA